LIDGINHVTFAVTDLERSVGFSVGGLGARVARKWRAGAYLELGNLWLCLTVDSSLVPSAGYSHVAFDVAPDAFPAAVRRLESAGARQWKENRSEGASFYFLDPDGHRLELHVGTLRSRLDSMECCS
jgi:catechol 2,3-dioxygenase-like lactoylglutathione lyase family enzyme